MIGLFLCGAVWAGVGIAFWCYDRKFFKHAIMVRGIVSGIHERADYDHEHGRQTMYSAIVTFEFDGKTRQVTEGSSASWKPKLGKERWVGVDPNNIEKARVYSKGSLILYGLFIGAGFVMMGGAIYGWLS